ncbi:MAG: cupin domain-containing protein [archaeon]|nr:cupin domain-containing protein [archaeon]
MYILKKSKAPRYTRDGITSYLLVSERTCDSNKLSTTIVEMKPGSHQKFHSHDPEQMYYILEGQGEMTVGGEKNTVTSGDCIYFPGNTIHGLKNTGNRILRYFSAASPSFTKEECIDLWPLQSDDEKGKDR